MTLTVKVFKSGFWATAIKVVSKGMGLIRIIVLARLLSPEDFGLMAVVLLTIEFFYLFSQFKVDMALIQNRGNIDAYLGTAWALAIGRGLLICLTMLIASPVLASFFNNEGAKTYIQVAAFAPLVLGLCNPRLVYLDKELNFKKKFYYEFCGAIVDMTVSITLAVIFKNVWALIAGLLMGNLTRLIVSFLIMPARFELSFDGAKAKELFNFGKWIFLSGILLFLSTRGGDLFVGKLVGLTALGYYQMALRVSTLVPVEIENVFNQVVFPAYSKIQDDRVRLKKALLKVGQANNFINFPLAILTCYFAPDITKYVLGDKWVSIIPLIQTFALMTMCYSLGTPFNSYYISIGRTDIIFRLRMVHTFILFSFIYSLTIKYGVFGASLAVFLSALVVIPVNVFVAKRMIRFTVKEYVKMFREVIMSSTCMLISLFCLNMLVNFSVFTFLKPILMFLCSAVIYYTSLLFFMKIFKNDLHEYIVLNNFRKNII